VAVVLEALIDGALATRPINRAGTLCADSVDWKATANSCTPIENTTNYYYSLNANALKLTSKNC
jgi:hypothetical protein